MILIFNLSLLFVFIFIAAYGRFRYQNRIQEASLKENRYITTEWHLLQIMKNQAEEELESKNQEIQRLRDQYEKLKKEAFGESALREIEERIHTAEAERDKILDQMTLDIPIDISADIQDEIDTAPLIVRRLSLSDNFNRQELIELRRKEKADQVVIDQLKDQVGFLVADRNSLEDTLTADRSRFERDLSLVNSRNSALVSEFEGLKESVREESAALDGQDIIDIRYLTRYELVGVILNLPEIREQYPELNQDLSDFIEKIRSIERSKGAQNAYEKVLDRLESNSP